ncbi:MAG: hypothetical protein CME70_11355 [Halobacteriovorax sp.]|nr:hypothetical protein [Halobacteriovorax sp.]
MNPFSHLSDEELMKLYQKGESMAFDVIYSRNKGRVYSYLKKRVSDDISVDEIFQNIMIKFHKSRMNYDSKFPLGKWLYTICKSELLDYLKKRKVQFEEIKDEHLKVSDPNLLPEIDLEEFKNLSEREREAISLRFYSDKDYSEISELLNITETNARKTISRGIKKIRLKLLGGQSE